MRKKRWFALLGAFWLGLSLTGCKSDCGCCGGGCKPWGKKVAKAEAQPSGWDQTAKAAQTKPAYPAAKSPYGEMPVVTAPEAPVTPSSPPPSMKPLQAAGVPEIPKSEPVPSIPGSPIDVGTEASAHEPPVPQNVLPPMPDVKAAPVAVPPPAPAVEQPPVEIPSPLPTPTAVPEVPAPSAHSVPQTVTPIPTPATPLPPQVEADPVPPPPPPGLPPAPQDVPGAPALELPPAPTPPPAPLP